MSVFTQFDTGLHVRYHPEASSILGDTYWQLTKGFTYKVGHIDSNQSVTVPAGFLSNGADVPLPFRWIIERMGKHSQAVFLHDFLCENLEIEIEGKHFPITRQKADYIFYEAMGVLDYNKYLIKLVKLGVDFYRYFFKPGRSKVHNEKIRIQNEYLDNHSPVLL